MEEPEFFDELLAPAIRNDAEPRASVTKGIMESAGALRDC